MQTTGTRQLVFADDGSQGADAAWLWVNEHPWDGWAVEVLRCVPGEDEPGPAEPWEPPRPRRLLGAAGEAPVLHLRVPGEPRAVLAGLDHGDLLVVGSKGRGLLKALHLGSVSEHLVGASARPLVIARGGHRTRRVVVCTDGSADSRRAAEVFADLPMAASAEVLVVSVPESGFDAEAAARSQADRLVGRVAAVQWCVVEEDPMEAFHRTDLMLLDLLGKEDTDLVVLGSRGLSGLAALRAGSLASVIAGRAPCSVLLAQAD